MAFFDQENVTSTFSDFVRIEPLQETEDQRAKVRNAAFLLFIDAYKRFGLVLDQPWGWVEPT